MGTLKIGKISDRFSHRVSGIPNDYNNFTQYYQHLNILSILTH